MCGPAKDQGLTAGAVSPTATPVAAARKASPPTAPAAAVHAKEAPSSSAEDVVAVEGYKTWVDPIKKSAAFDELEALMKERIIFIDGAMGTQIQKYKLQEEDFRGDRCAVVCGSRPLMQSRVQRENS